MIIMFQEIDGLTEFQKISLINRYISVMEDFQTRVRTYSLLYHIGHYTVTVGSLLVPALLSIQYSSDTMVGNISVYVYWVTWVISLLVTKWNGILALFRVDKKYYFLNTSLEHLKSEMSQYINLSGKYGGHYTKGKKPTHANQLMYICHNIEKIKLKQVEEEYYKLLESLEDHTAHSTAIVPVGATAQNMVGGMFNPTPTTNELQEHQAVLARALLPSVPLGGGNSNGWQIHSQGQTQTQTATNPTVQISIPVQAQQSQQPQRDQPQRDKPTNEEDYTDTTEENPFLPSTPDSTPRN